MARRAHAPIGDGYWLPEEGFDRLLRVQRILAFIADLDTCPKGTVKLDNIAALSDLLIEELATVIGQSKCSLTGTGGEC